MGHGRGRERCCAGRWWDGAKEGSPRAKGGGSGGRFQRDDQAARTGAWVTATAESRIGGGRRCASHPQPLLTRQRERLVRGRRASAAHSCGLPRHSAAAIQGGGYGDALTAKPCYTCTCRVYAQSAVSEERKSPHLYEHELNLNSRNQFLISACAADRQKMKAHSREMALRVPIASLTHPAAAFPKASHHQRDTRGPSQQ